MLVMIKTVLIVGTADTKSDELQFLQQKILALGAQCLLMDVGVLGGPVEGSGCKVDISSADVAKAAGMALARIAALGDENSAMKLMALGASKIAAQMQQQGKIHAMLALGGTMGTDLAFDVAAALPLGFPKVIVSTVAFSHLIAPERITPDLIVVLWAGGLYGLNSLCKSALAQGAGSIVGAMQAVQVPDFSQPIVAITSLGKTCLNYMVALKPALEARGFEVIVFHSTGMGGRAFEAMAEQGKFACVMDLCLQELANHVGGSCVSSGASRLLGAGKSCTPQIVAPGAADMIDFPAWQPVPVNLAGRNVHVHNRLIASATSPIKMRRAIAKEIVERARQSQAATHLIVPLKGVQVWDLPGQPLYDPEGLLAMTGELTRCASAVENTSFSWQSADVHINDAAFVDLVLAKFDEWLASGVIKRARSN
jgi:uncharacterized protein (UPF0261 family)